MAYFSLADLRDFCLARRECRLWMGLDVHKRSYSVAMIVDDERVFTWSAPADANGLVRCIEELGGTVVGACFEAGPTGFALARELQQAGVPVIVAAPNKVPRSVSPGSKTDRLDCIKLARFASKGLIRPIAIPSLTAESERALLRRRHQLADSIRRSKQRIKAMFLFHGCGEPDSLKHWGDRTADALGEARFPPAAKQSLESHVRELQFLTDEQRLVLAHLRTLAREAAHRRVIDALMSVPGVGIITALSFHLELFEPARFHRGEEVTSYLGLAPTVRHSGEHSPRARLVPVGQKRLRSLLIEAAWIWKANDEQAQSIYRKVLGRTAIPQKAIVAVARKLAIILWRLSVEQRAYRSLAA